jgi:all-trans-retinol dehydrogenase (NAD+)
VKNLFNQRVLITGGGSGIGRQMALNFAKEGSRIVLWDINEEAVSRVAEEIEPAGVDVWKYVCNVADRETVYQTAEQVKKDVGNVDVLVNNAGVVTGKPFLQCSDDDIIKTMDVNIMAHFWTVRSFLPEMIQANHGHLVTIASAGGWIGVNSLADYCASKFAAVGFDESIRMELRKKGLRGVKTTLVSPYYINTGMFKGVKSKYELILPILDEHFVARRIVRAVKNDCAVLKMPPIVYLLPLLRLLPVKLFDLLADILGISSTMDEFIGRQE